MRLLPYPPVLPDPETVLYKTRGTLRYVGTDTSAIGSDSVTGETGYLQRVLNHTGHISVKGELLPASTTVDHAVGLQTNEYDTVGVVQEAGIAEGALMWIWKGESLAEVLLKDGVAATRGEILLAADTNGRAITTANPGSGLPGTDIHFKECGHVFRSVTAGTGKLTLASLHFN